MKADPQLTAELALFEDSLVMLSLFGLDRMLNFLYLPSPR